MAILRADNGWAGEVLPAEGSDTYVRGVLRALWRIGSDRKPADVRDCEISVVILFQTSLFINALTGGDPDMTFSARCHWRRTWSRRRSSRIAWGVAALAVDAACALSRGERQHCAVAWENYLMRGAPTADWS